MAVSKRTSTSQFEIILHYFEKHPRLITGKVDEEFTKEIKDEIWSELAAVLNADSNGPSKSIMGWRKTLKDWKCYVRKKAARIASHQTLKEGLHSKETLSVTEIKLLAAIGEIPASAIVVAESPVCGRDNHDISIRSDVMNDLQDEEDNYNGNWKAVKRNVENPLIVKISDTCSLNKTNDNQHSTIDIAERKVALLQQQVSLLETRTLAAERRAEAKDKLVLLKVRELHQEWKKQMQILRLKKLQYL